MENKFTGWGIVAIVFVLALALGAENGGMMNLHGGSIVAQKDAETLSQIEPAAGNDCTVPNEMMNKVMSRAYFRLKDIDYNVVEQGTTEGQEDPSRLNIYIDSDNMIRDMKCG